MSHVFISYKSEDRARVKPLVEALEAEGLEVWWDVHVEGGAAWREAIQTQLDAAQCVIVVWSEASVGPAGHFVQDEASRANARGVYLPVAIDAVQPPLGFGQKQVLKLAGWRGSRRDPRLADVVRAARAMVDDGPRPVPAPPGRRSWAGIGPLGWRAAAFSAVLVALLLGAGYALTKLRPHAGAAPQAQAATAPANSIAVLPFENLSGDPKQDYFSEGLSEELIGDLSKLDALQVAARTSSFKFKGSKDDSGVIGAKLGVAYLLDGSVRRDGELVRVSTELVDAKSGFERWSQTYDKDMKDIFAVQSGIAQAVADALKVRLMGGDIAALSSGATSSPAAYDAYLRGRRLFDAGGDEAAHRDALARFDAAIAADPDYAAAYAARARTLSELANQFEPPGKVRATFDAALASARKAVALSPDLAEAQATLASTLLIANLNFSEARPIYARAMALGGGDADILTRFGLFSSNAGDFVSGLAAVRRAAVLDPLNPRVFRSLGSALLRSRRYPEAIAAMRRALELSPETSAAHAVIGDALLMQGQLRAAMAEYALEPTGSRRHAGQAIVMRRLNDSKAADMAFKQLTADANGFTDYQQAEVYAQWGDLDRAFGALDAAFKHGDSGAVFLKGDPLMDPLRSDARFGRFLARLGLAA